MTVTKNVQIRPLTPSCPTEAFYYMYIFLLNPNQRVYNECSAYRPLHRGVVCQPLQSAAKPGLYLMELTVKG